MIGENLLPEAMKNEKYILIPKTFKMDKYVLLKFNIELLFMLNMYFLL